MAFDTKPNLNSDKFEQFSGETLNLSGTTNIVSLAGGDFQVDGVSILNKLTGGTINASNGITRLGDEIVLGGDLTGNTTIDANGNTFRIENVKTEIIGIGVTSGNTLFRLADNTNSTIAEFRDNGVGIFNGNIGFGTSTFPSDSKIIVRGIDTTALNNAARFENFNGDLIGQFKNDQSFELGGTSAILEVNANIQSGNAALKFLSYTGGTGLGYRFQDSNLNDYMNFRSLTYDRGVLFRQPVEFDYNQGYRRITRQYSITTSTSNGAQNLIFEIPIEDNEHYDIKVLHADATAPDASSITILGIDSVDCRKLSGSTVTGNTTSSTLSKLPNTLTGNFNWNFDTDNNTIQYRFQNESSGGKEYVIWVEISYVKRSTPILE